MHLKDAGKLFGNFIAAGTVLKVLNNFMTSSSTENTGQADATNF